MYYPPSVKVKAITELNQRRKHAERQYELSRAQALERVPGLAELEAEISSACVELCRIIGMGDDALRLVEQLKRNNLAAQKRERDLLIQHGWPPNAMQVRYTCPGCDDTGFTDEGYFCECHKLLLKELEHERLAELFPLDKYTFDSFSVDYYPAAQRGYMRDMYLYCKNYAGGFDLEMPNLFFYGESGLGKTHLSGAIVNGVIAGGYGVEYGSVPILFAQLAKERFDSRAREVTQRALLSADLLVLDDLGAEATNALTIESLYTLMNTRLSRKLPTVINSNCSAVELQERYGRRIASRLLYDEYRAFAFLGTDIREQKADT
jgi:DNA replication protein DnaC